ncbi:redoxin domain-containing protein [Deinococcus lacus]|uniref:Redoxin domain-containing protein n=1 Tax=Deinococcus lacus TaxID=392561 RepID=A0ABW1YEI3_9DEIO
MTQPTLLGQLAPDFTLTAVTGGQTGLTSLSSYRGKYVVLVFFPVAFSPLCSEQLPEYSMLQDDFLERGAAVLGISRDNPFSLRAWSERYGLELPLLSDMTLKVAQQYGVALLDHGHSTRAVFVIDPEGRVIHEAHEASPEHYDIKPEQLLDLLPA